MQPGEHVSDLVAGYVLGALEPDELERVERHLAVCPDCRRAVEEARGVVALLPYAVDPVPVPKRARQTLFAQLPERRGVLVSVTALFAGPVRWAAASAAALLALVLVWASARQTAPVATPTTIPTPSQRAVIELVSHGTGFVTQLTGTGASPGIRGGVILDPSSNAALIMMQNVPRPPTGQVYVVWLVRNGQYRNAGILPVDSLGNAELYLTPQETLSTFDGIAITLESASLAASPSGQQIAFATITRSGR
ncbi:MAG: anti-sigma factor [Thermorudis peleae]|nr:anti-sigma factor [Thermorudis peleae]